MKRFLILALILFVGLATFGVWRVFLRPRGAGFGPIETIEKVGDNAYMIAGAGGNTAVFVTARGVVLVDTKVAGNGQGLLDQVRTVTDKPVTHIINTHSHGDHTGSNDFFPAAVEIVAHENTAADMKKMSNFLFGWKTDALPDRTYRDRLTLFSGPDSIDLYHFGPAHTSGDTFVVFPAAHVMHAGDVFAEKGVPRVDVTHGGGITYSETMRKAVSGIGGVSAVITGHGGRAAWSDFVEYARFTRALVEAATLAHKAGKTAEQGAAELSLPDEFKDYDTTGMAAMFDAVYAELRDDDDSR